MFPRTAKGNVVLLAVPEQSDRRPSFAGVALIPLPGQSVSPFGALMVVWLDLVISSFGDGKVLDDYDYDITTHDIDSRG
jgi:hypothetical protein